MDVRDTRSRRDRPRKCNISFASMERLGSSVGHCGLVDRTRRSSGFGSFRLSLSRSNSSPWS